MVLLRFSRRDFLFLGLELAGFSAHAISRNGKALNLQRFRDSFYAGPDTIRRDVSDQHPTC
jgi:hypothetical protein